MAKRYFVTIIAADAEAFSRLAAFDLVHGTAKARSRKEPTIEAIATLEDVERLVDAGYRVLVEEETSKRARARTHVIRSRRPVGGKAHLASRAPEGDRRPT